MTTRILSTRESEFLTMVSQVVSQAGGQFEGVQQSMEPVPPKVIFTNPVTGHRLTVDLVDKVEINPVREDWLFALVTETLIVDTNLFQNRKISVTVTTLLRLAQTLTDVSAELNALCAKKVKS